MQSKSMLFSQISTATNNSSSHFIFDAFTLINHFPAQFKKAKVLFSGDETPIC